MRGAAAASVAAVLAAALDATRLLSPLDLVARDAALRVLPRRAASSVAVVVVDEDALRAVGPWPWDRGRIAALVDGVRRAGARGVVLDVLLPEERPGDTALAASLAALPSVLAVGVDDRGGWLLPAPALRGAGTLAHVSFETDRDGVVRRFVSTKQDAARSLPALAVAAALRPGFRVAGLPTVGAARLLESGTLPAALAGRVVFVGATAAGIGDRVVSPLGRGGVPLPGVLVQAAAAESLLSGDVLRPLPPIVTALVAGLASLLAARRKGSLAALSAALVPLPAGVMILGMGGLELSSVTAAAGAVSVSAVTAAVAAARERRDSAAALRRVGELTALAARLEDGRRDEAEARRVVAHELKTPLTSVRGLAQLLADFDLSGEERRRVASLVVAETSRLSWMVEALLDLERMKLRPFGSHARGVDLSRLAEERAAVLTAASAGPFAREIAPGLRVQGDADLLGRVVDNLVSNAVKFSPGGAGVTLRLRADGENAVLEVADRGPGIPPSERETIFRRFARGSASAGVPGLGLGLALVGEAVAWHGGRVEVDANPGGGSVFRAFLPLLPLLPLGAPAARGEAAS